MPKYPATAQITVPVQMPKTTNIPDKREKLTVVCTVIKKLGPGVITATLHIDITPKRVNTRFMISALNRVVLVLTPASGIHIERRRSCG